MAVHPSTAATGSPRRRRSMTSRIARAQEQARRLIGVTVRVMSLTHCADWPGTISLRKRHETT